MNPPRAQRSDRMSWSGIADNGGEAMWWASQRMQTGYPSPTCEWEQPFARASLSCRSHDVSGTLNDSSETDT